MKVKLNNGGLLDGRYIDEDGYVWAVARLIEYGKDLEPFDIPLSAIDISRKPFKAGTMTAREVAEHVKRTLEADLQYPVIMDPDGYIMDGWHRVMRALVEGRETIKAVRFEKMPPWEFKEDEE